MIFEKILSNKGNLISDLYLFTPKIFEDTRGAFTKAGIKIFLIILLAKKLNSFKIINQFLG